jgi:hypothetical protein
MQDRYRRHHLGDNGRCRPRRRSDSRGRGCAATPLEHLHDHITLVGIQAAELVLDIDTGLAAGVDEIFRLNVQLARQRIDTDFILQAKLLYTTSPFSFAEGQVGVNTWLTVHFNGLLNPGKENPAISWVIRHLSFASLRMTNDE